MIHKYTAKENQNLFTMTDLESTHLQPGKLKGGTGWNELFKQGLKRENA